MKYDKKKKHQMCEERLPRYVAFSHLQTFVIVFLISLEGFIELIKL